MVDDIKRSKYETRLKSASGAATDLVTQGALDLRLAAYLARKGSIEDAERKILEIRNAFAINANAEILAHANFAEAIVRYFRDGPNASLDKLNRSIVISAGLPRSGEFPSLPLAWLAACYRQGARWTEMLDAIKRSISNLSLHSPEASCRLSISIADALQETCDYKSSSIWYNHSRKLATEIGDDSAITAMLYNRAALRLFNTRISALLDSHPDIEGCAVDIEAFSAQNYADYTAENSMRWVFDMLRGQLCLLRGDYKMSLEALGGATLSEQLRGWPGVNCLRLADIAVAQANLFPGHAYCSDESLLHLLETIPPGLPSGDVALICHSCLRVLSTRKSPIEAGVRSRMESSLADYQRETAAECAVLHELEDWMKSQELKSMVIPKQLFFD